MPNPYSPPGESATDIWFEQSNLVGAVLGGVAYGAHVIICADCVYHIVPRKNCAKRKSTLRSGLLLVYVFALFALGTINFAGNTRITQLMFIDNRAYPGGPNAWFKANYNNVNVTDGNAAYIIANFMADGLLLWRTYVVWDSLLVVIFPLLVFLASTAMSILTLFQSSRPDADLWSQTTVQFSVPYFSISIGLNIMLTLLLVIRLLCMSSYIGRTIGPAHGKTYISVAAMLLESATPYAVTGLIFIITYARNSNVQNLVLPVLSQVMCINPEIIIMRVAMGRAHDRSRSRPLSTDVELSRSARTSIKFATSTNSHLASKDTPSGLSLATTGSSITVMELQPAFNLPAIE
ncbi:hypothetical protein C8Q79DRAFT_488197 [Trametes meyenii]|nr:hypothetical protein C8Q79DRAFT_488197 [Trametes meyenii]